MAFRFKSKEAVGEAVRRGVRREVDRALEALRAGDPPDEAAFDARKRFKRVRAALRLVRADLGDTVYRRENLLFRDAARPLAEARDAAMLVEALDRLTGPSPGDAGAFDDVRRALLSRRQTVLHEALDGAGAFAGVAGVVAPALARIDDWTVDRDGWTAL